MRVCYIAGARPNFVKVAALWHEGTKRDVEQTLIHTGQHYDNLLSESMFSDLRLPRPSVHLGVRAAHAVEQIALMLHGLIEPLGAMQPSVVIVVGDVNSTLAGALAAVKMGIPLVHVEAGLRSYDWTMTEEQNRVVVDHLSDVLLASEESGMRNLERESPPGWVVFTGNVMIDTLLRYKEAAGKALAWRKFDLIQGEYGLITIHRPGLVDDETSLSRFMEAVVDLNYPLLLATHPRTANSLERFGLGQGLAGSRVQVCPAQGYVDFVSLMSGARFVITDSGGVQEETTVLGVPCLTYRENTERPATVECGGNTVVGLSPAGLAAEVQKILSGRKVMARLPDKWDGKAAERVWDAILEFGGKH